MSEDIFQVGDCIDKRYIVTSTLDRGGYGSFGIAFFSVFIVPGEIYQCVSVDGGKPVAVKVERSVKPGNLKEEELVLSGLQGK
jgi:hypothetical protein